jgi:hypothetical protein
MRLKQHGSAFVPASKSGVHRKPLPKPLKAAKRHTPLPRHIDPKHIPGQSKPENTNTKHAAPPKKAHGKVSVKSSTSKTSVKKQGRSFSHKLSTGQRFGKVAKKATGKVTPGRSEKILPRKFHDKPKPKQSLLHRAHAIATAKVTVGGAASLLKKGVKALANRIKNGKGAAGSMHTGRKGGKYVIGASGKKLYLSKGGRSPSRRR